MKSVRVASFFNSGGMRENTDQNPNTDTFQAVVDFLNTLILKYPLLFYSFFNISPYFSLFHNFFYFCQHFYDHLYSIFFNPYVFTCTRPSVSNVSIVASTLFTIDLVAPILVTFMSTYHINRTTANNYYLFLEYVNTMACQFFK